MCFIGCLGSKAKLPKSKIYNKIFDSNMVMPGYKLKKILLNGIKLDSNRDKRKQKMINLRLIINKDNIAYLEFYSSAEPKLNPSTTKIIFSSRQTLPSTMEFQGKLPIE